ATPNLICAEAALAAIKPEASAAAKAIRLFMPFSPGRPRRRRCAAVDTRRGFNRETRQKSLGLMQFPTGRDAVPRGRLTRRNVPNGGAESRTAAPFAATA